MGVITYPNLRSLVAIGIGPRLRESGVHTAAVVFDAGRLEVNLANGDAGLEPTLVLKNTYPEFVPFDVYVGFAGATGNLPAAEPSRLSWWITTVELAKCQKGKVGRGKMIINVWKLITAERDLEECFQVVVWESYHWWACTYRIANFSVGGFIIGHGSPDPLASRGGCGPSPDLRPVARTS